ncbi:MAG: hypothetical protein IJG60_07980 [Thermoguttaceae bacterium]|nr:hypothetical protein [Thermoguttaceae bacterium]
MFLALCGVYVTAYGGENQKDLLKTLEQGVDRQLREVEFKCTYTYTEYVVETLEEAERFDTTNGRLVVHATGTLAKNKKMTYESLVVDKLETRVPEYYMDHVTVTNQELRACYRKQSLQHPYRTLFVLSRQEENKDLPILNLHEGRFFCPLTVGGSRSRPNFLDHVLLTPDKYADTTDVSLLKQDEDTVVRIHHTSADSAVHSVSDEAFTISNSFPYPVLLENASSKMLHYVRFDKDATRTSNLKNSDFVRLNDGCVLPKKIQEYSTIFFDDYRKEDVGKWVVKKWESDDMGKERPKKSDFYIHLDRNSDIGGLALSLNYKLEKNLPEYFDINKYGVRDLQTSSPIESQLDGHSDLTVWIRPAILLIAGLFIVFGIWKKWKSAGQSASA